MSLFIISIILGLAMLRIDFHNPESELKQEARRLARAMELANQEAVLQSMELGLLVQEDNYSFYRYQDRQWAILDDPLLKEHRFKKPIEVELVIEGITESLRPAREQKDPQIVIEATGDITPFEVIFRDPQSQNLTYVVRSTGLGKLELERETN